MIVDREEVAKAIWESQRARIRNQDGLNARLTWGSEQVPDVFWESYRLDADAAIAAIKRGGRDG